MTERTFRTAARYLGAGTARQAEELRPLMEKAEAALKPCVCFKQLVKRYPVTVDDGGFQLGGLPAIPSRHLCRLFEGAEEGLAVAVTLGAEVDTLVKRLLLGDPALGAAVGAAASAYVDELLDGVMAAEQARIAPLHLSPRFSPGYGDVPLSYQRPLTEALECWRIGIRLTDSCLMLPEKSITALCALLPPGECPQSLRREHGCDRCPDTQCPYREVNE